MKHRLQIGLLMAISALVYGNTLANSFTMDDELYVFRNPQVTNFSFHALFQPNVASNVFRPVTFATLVANWALGGTQAFAYHLVNLILQVGVTLALYLLLLALLEDLAGAETMGFAGTLLFAVHPIHTEAIASIIGRSELLAAGFLFAAWLLHLRDRAVLSGVSFVCALLSKESAIVFLPMLLIVDYSRDKRKPWTRYAALAAISAIYLCTLWKIQGGHFGAASVSLLDNPLYRLPLVWRVLNAIRIGWKYLSLMVFPLNLSCDYSFNEITLYGDLRHTLPAALAALTVFAGWIWAVLRRNAGLAIAGAMYLIGFSVTANVLTPTGTIMGERLAYLPTAGFCVLVVLPLPLLFRKNRIATVALLWFFVAALGARTLLRNRDWRDNLSLYTAAVKVVPGSAKMHAYLGGEYLNRGQFDAARAEFQTALRIYPEFPDTIESLGLLESWTGNRAEGLRLMEQALRMSDRSNINYDYMAVNYAALLMQVGRPADALTVLDREIAEAPTYARAWSNRAALRYEQRQYAYAKSDAETALRLDPKNAQAAGVLQKVADGQLSPAPISN